MFSLTNKTVNKTYGERTDDQKIIFHTNPLTITTSVHISFLYKYVFDRYYKMCIKTSFQNNMAKIYFPLKRDSF